MDLHNMWTIATKKLLLILQLAAWWHSQRAIHWLWSESAALNLNIHSSKPESHLNIKIFPKLFLWARAGQMHLSGINWTRVKPTDSPILSGNYYPLAQRQRAPWKLTQTHSPPSSSALRHPPRLPLWHECGRRQTCPARLCVAPRGEQSLGFCLQAGGRPGRFPPGHTLPFGPAARPPPAACLHWCMYSTSDRGQRTGRWINQVI